MISEPVLVTPHNNEAVQEVGRGENSSLQGEVVVHDVSQDLEKQNTVVSDASNDPERLREEQAAIKAQAAFRGYLVMFLFSDSCLILHAFYKISLRRVVLQSTKEPDNTL